MNILVINDAFPPMGAGAARLAWLLAREYAQKGNEVSFVTVTHEKKEEITSKHDNLHVHKLYVPHYNERWRAYFGIYNPRAYRKLKDFFKKNTFDIIHVHNIHSYLSYSICILAAAKSKKVILTFHDSMSFDYGKFTSHANPNDCSDEPAVNYKLSTLKTIKTYRLHYFLFRNYFIRTILRKYSNFQCAVSQELQKALKANNVPCSGFIHNGICTDEFIINHKDIEDFKIKYMLKGRKVIMYGGRISHWKGALLLMEAMKNIIADIPAATLLFIGTTGSSLEKYCTYFKLENHFVCAPWLDGTELVAAYHSSDVVAVPSIYLDPFPTMNLEAMACKKPVIGTVFGGTKEIIINRETGYLVNPFNVAQMAAHIGTLLKDKNLALKFGEAGYRRLLEKFTITQAADEYLKLFDY